MRREWKASETNNKVDVWRGTTIECRIYVAEMGDAVVVVTDLPALVIKLL